MDDAATLQSAVYTGIVSHTRLRPKKHSFQYRVFSLFIALDELEYLGKSLSLFRYNKPSILSFHDADHGDGSVGGLKSWVAAHLSSAGLQSDNLRIFVLCYPRIFGYVFNPLTIYFCYDEKQQLVAFLYEVSNTFGERHTYVMPAPKSNIDADEITVNQRCEKRFHVSPFIPMECVYNFKITVTAKQLTVAIYEEDKDGLLLVASFQGAHAPLTNKTIRAAFLKHPLMSAKVSASILWEAFRLWKMGLPIFRHQPASAKRTSTVVAPTSKAIYSEE
jgi:DUF1365 family protein